jgi:hypothetical protein
MTDKELARLWDTVFNLRLHILPPAREGAPWVARTVGGVHDDRKLAGTGRTPEAAVQDLLGSRVVSLKF